MGRKTKIVMGVTALALVAVVAADVWATPPNIGAHQGPFTLTVTITHNELCFVDPNNQAVTRRMNHGIDATGPYFSFWAQGPGGSTQYTYRPQGLSPNSVAQFGDGGINATALFRKQFERLYRGANHYQAGPANNNFWQPPCLFVPPPPGLPIQIQSVVTQEELMVPTGLTVVVDPVTFCFEMYDFDYRTQG